jgi:hypothetical protein
VTLGGNPLRVRRGLEPGPLRGLLEVNGAGRSPPVTVSLAPQRQIRISAETQRELVDLFWDGAFKTELARSYGVHAENKRAITCRHMTRATTSPLAWRPVQPVGWLT